MTAFPLRFTLLAALLAPIAAPGQAAPPDSAKHARAESLYWRADTLASSGGRANVLQALALWRDAAAIYESGGAAQDLADVFDRIADAHSHLGMPDSALSYYARSLPIWEAEDPLREALTLNSIGLIQARLGRPDSARAYYARALRIRRDVGDRSGEAVALNNLGGVQSALGRPDSALVYFAEARSIRVEVGDRSGEAATLNNIGAVHDATGRPDSALAYYALALRIVRETGHRYGEAATLSNIGSVQGNLGRPDSALAYFGRALPIQREVGDGSGEAITLNSIGLVHSNLGRPDSALAYFERALTIQLEVGFRSGAANALNSIGLVHSNLGRPDSALAYFSRALRIQQEVGDRSGEARSLSNIGLVHYNLGRPDSSLSYFARALPIRREVGDRSGEANTLTNIGQVQSNMGHPDSALANFARALPLRRAVGDRSGEAVTLRNVGDVLLRSTHEGSALLAAARFDSAGALLARIRRSAGGDANAVSFSELGGDVFTSWSYAWHLLAQQSHAAGDSAGVTRAVASSLAAAERGRAQALRDLLDRRPGAMAAGLDASDTIPGADLAAEAGRLLAPLRATNAALLYYLSDGDTLLAWFLSASGVLEVLAPIVRPGGELAQQIATAREVLGADAAAARQRRGDPPMARPNRVSRDGLGGSAGDPASAMAALQALSAGVLPTGLEALLPPGTELVIVPHGALGQVPFAALTLPGDTIPLGVRNPLRHAPSLRALAAAEAPVAGAERRALVVGDPQMPEVRDETGTLHQLSKLPGAAEEGRWVATKLGTQVLTGSAASESAVRSSLSSAWVVHLATHGLAYGTEARVRDSYVALAPGAGQDGLLTLGELLDDNSLRLTADLIVLSACQTGLGEAREAEGTVGLQRGLLAKGARSVLVSLWSVDDAATRLLMERFYTHWLGHDGRPALSKAEALRLAQMEVRATKQFTNPRYWAAFQLVGAR